MKILVLDASNQNTLAIVRHLGLHHEIHVAGYNKASVSFYSRFKKKKFLITDPKKDEQCFFEQLRSLLMSEQYDLLMPVGFKSYQVCAKHQDEIRQLTNLVVTSDENIRLASDKNRTYHLAEQLNIPYPKTYIIQSMDELHKLEFNFPIVIKAPFESGKNIVMYAHNKEELVRKFETMCIKNNYKSPHLPLLQDYITGDGYGFFAYYDKGTCKRWFLHHRIREYPVTGGASVCAESFVDPELKKQGMKILDYLKWDGVAMVEFKKDNSSGLYKLIEINPKFWGSLELAIVSGVNFPEMLVKRATGEEISFSEKDTTTFQWLINGELFHFIERPSSIFNILKTLLKSKTDFRWSDPLPNMVQIVYIFIHYLKKLTS